MVKQSAPREKPAKIVAQDPAPEAAAPLEELIVLQSAAERDVLAPDVGTELIVRVRLTAKAIPSAERPSINLALVVDTSGSMKGEPIDHARRACATIVDKLHKGDRLSIVTFGSKAQVLVPSTVLDDDNVAAVKTKIESMVESGTTNMSDGLALGLAEAQKGIVPNGINRIVLLGDGVPNDAPRTLAQANVAASRNMPITSLGLGADFDETLMNQVAQSSGGTFHFIDEPQRVSAVFEKEVTRLERAVAQHGYLDITPGPGVTLHRTLGIPSAMQGRTLRAQIGQLSEGQVRDVMVLVSVGPHHDGANIELADASFHYQDAAQGQGGRELTQFIALRASKDPAELAEGRHADVEHAAVRMRVADMFVRAIAMARGNDVSGARKLLREAEAIARAGAKRFDDASLTVKAEEARELFATVAKLAPPPAPVRPHWGPGRIGTPTTPTPMPRPQALGLRRAHGGALDTINGF